MKHSNTKQANSNPVYFIPKWDLQDSWLKQCLKNLYFCVVTWSRKHETSPNLDSFDRCFDKKWCFVWQVWSTPRDIYLVQNLVLWRKDYNFNELPASDGLSTNSRVYPTLEKFYNLISYNLFFYFYMFSSNNLTIYRM